MFKFPSSTDVQQKLKVSDVLKVINADKTTKEESQNVQSMTMTNALSEEKTGLKKSAEVNEIYVIRVQLKSDNSPQNFLTQLDKSILFQVLFILEFEGRVKFRTGYKNIKETKVTQTKVFESDWVEETPQDMPLVSNLTDLYKAMLEILSALRFRTNEKILEWQQRFLAIEKLEKEFKKVERLADAEIQPKKKFEYSDRLRDLYNKIMILKN